ncbi:MAG: thioesterase [Bacteroidota bacterium]|nr:thioesterase [Bacteroidota bacterium]
MNPAFGSFRKKIIRPLWYRLFLLQRLPMAFIAGLKIVLLNESQSVVSVRFKWLNQNPFRSIYFAVLSMAAEMSTGLLVFGQVYKRNPAVSMLVVEVKASFFKKAVGGIIFTCADGNTVDKAIEQCITTGEAVQIECCSVGKNNQGEEVASFMFVWSCKVKKV